MRERAIAMAEKLMARGAGPDWWKLAGLVDDPSARVRMQLAFTAPVLPALAPAYARLAVRDFADKWISAALLSGSPEMVTNVLFPAMTRDPVLAKKAAPFVARLVEIRAASKPADGYASLIDFIAQPGTSPLWLRALGDGLRRAGTAIEKADAGKKLDAVFARAAATAADQRQAHASGGDRTAQRRVAGAIARALAACLAPGQPRVQFAAVKALAAHTAGRGPDPPEPLALRPARETVLSALLAREDQTSAVRCD